MEFQPLTEEFVNPACKLSTQAGWEQTPEDWRRLLRMNPEGVWIWVDAGAVRASFSLAAYGRDLSWIGMILVDTAYRGRGIGKTAFALALEKAKTLGASCIGLDATESGEMIYHRFGFEPAGAVTRWRGKWSSSGTNALPLITGFDETIAVLDRQVTGIDRTSLLKDLAANGALFLSAREGGETVGYVVAKPSRTAIQVGPLISPTASHFEHLLWGCASHGQGRPLLCDALHPDAAPVLHAHGLVPERILKRMTLPASPHCLRNGRIWCGAGFELG